MTASGITRVIDQNNPEMSCAWCRLSIFPQPPSINLLAGETSAEVEIEGFTAAFLGYCQALALSSLPKEALSEECTLLPVLLRLLGLVASQGSRLPEAVVRGGLGLVPPQLWLPVLPQLLGQLASSSCHVAARQAFVGLLTSLSEASPASAMLSVLAELRDPSPDIGKS